MAAKEETEDGPVMKAMYLRQDQDEFLRWTAYTKRVSQTEVIRDAIDAWMKNDKDWQRHAKG